jgi:hypothetical protein
MESSIQSTNGVQQASYTPHLIPTDQEQYALPERASAAPPPGVDGDLEPDTTQPDTAKAYRDFGLDVIPVLVGTTQAAVSTTRWIADLSSETIDAHWTKHPDHEAGFVVGENLIVFRVNGGESMAAFVSAMSECHVKPTMVVKGSEGNEFFFWRSEPTSTASISGQAQRRHGHIEILTDEAIVLLPPNRGKTISAKVSNTGDFTEVGQGFLDAVLQHNASPAEVDTHADAEVVAPIATPVAAGPTFSTTWPVEGGKGGEGGVLAEPVARSTALPTLTALPGPSLKNVITESDPPAATPVAIDSTFSANAPVEGGEGGVQSDLVGNLTPNTALTTLTPVAGPTLKNVNSESDPSAGALSADTTISNSELIQGGEGGEAGVQAVAASVETFSKKTPSEGGGTGEGGVLPSVEAAASEATGLQDLALVAAPSPQATGTTIGYSGDDDDVLTPKAAINPVITALEAANLYLTPLGSGNHSIVCPWAHEHRLASAMHTVYSEPDEFHSTGRFICPHEHLERHTTKDLLEFLGVPNSEAKHKPLIRIVAGELYRVVAAAEMVLETRASHFQTGTLIVSVATDPTTGNPLIVPTSVQALTSALSLSATFEKFDGRSGAWVTCDPPTRYVNILFRKQDYRYLSALAGLARQPFFRETDGALVTQPGYDKASQRFGVFDPHQFVIAEPTKAAALAALAMLTDLLVEFRFAQDHDKSAALSAIFTATVRPSLAQAPGYHVTSVIYGSGKSYLCKVVNGFAGPAESVKISFATTSEEATKSLMSVLVKNPAVIEFDDMTTDWIAHGIVNRMLTSENLTDRILGFSKTATVSTRTLFLSSGNNVGPVGDLLRRIITIYIDPRCEAPTTIEYKFHPAETVRENRAAYVAAVLTIILAWKAAGSPRADVSPIASYGGAWADYCRHPLIWLGLPDPATSLLEQVTQDPDSAALGVLLTEWHKAFSSRPTTVRKVIATVADGHEGLKAAIDEFSIVDRSGISATKLGQLLKKNANRLVGGYRFERSTADGRTAWAAIRVGTPPSPALPPSASVPGKTVAPTSSARKDFDPLDDY